MAAFVPVITDDEGLPLCEEPVMVVVDRFFPRLRYAGGAGRVSGSDGAQVQVMAIGVVATRWEKSGGPPSRLANP